MSKRITQSAVIVFAFTALQGDRSIWKELWMATIVAQLSGYKTISKMMGGDDM